MRCVFLFIQISVSRQQHRRCGPVDVYRVCVWAAADDDERLIGQPGAQAQPHPLTVYIDRVQRERERERALDALKIGTRGREESLNTRVASSSAYCARFVLCRGASDGIVGGNGRRRD